MFLIPITLVALPVAAFGVLVVGAVLASVVHGVPVARLRDLDI